MKVGSAETTSASTTRAVVEENDGAFAEVLGGSAMPSEEPLPTELRRHVGADLPDELDVEENPEPEIQQELEADAPRADLESEVQILSEPKRSFWERASQTVNTTRTAGDNRAIPRSTSTSFDVRLFERQASQPQSEAVVPGPRSVNVPPLKPMLSAADAALPTTVRPAGAQPELAEVERALRAPALPEAKMVEAAEPVRPARPAPSPPMSVSLQLATIAHDVLARAAEAIAPEAQTPEPPRTIVTLRPAPSQIAGQDAFIQIEHPILGRIRLQLVLDARNLSVRAVATSAAAAAALRESEESMREDVARHGVDLESLRVDLKRREREKK